MIVFLGLMIALNVALTEVAKLFQLIPLLTYIRPSLAFIPIAASAAMYGPLWAGAAAAAADVISYFLFPSGGPYFPGFTLSAFLAGIILGILIYRHKPSVFRALAACVLSIAIVDVALNTLWLHYFFVPGSLTALLLPRLIKSLIFAPFEVAITFALWIFVEKMKPRYIKSREGDGFRARR